MNEHDADLRATVTTDPQTGVTVTSTGVTIYPGEMDFRIPQGRQWSMYVTWNHKGQVVDTSSGYTAQFVAREVQGGTALLDLSESAGITLGASYITISRSAAQTAALSFVRAAYNLNVTQTSGTVTTALLKGFVDLDKSVMV